MHVTCGELGHEGGGIVLEPVNLSVMPELDASALARMITSAAPSARVVVLNACYSVALAEMNDLASGTSSWSTKLIHGGLRYLEHYEFRLVREALTKWYPMGASSLVRRELQDIGEIKDSLGSLVVVGQSASVACGLVAGRPG